MKTMWTPELVAQCRNHDVLRLSGMSLMAAFLIDLAFTENRKNIEYYGEAGWHPMGEHPRWFLSATTAYRIVPSYNPLRNTKEQK